MRLLCVRRELKAAIELDLSYEEVVKRLEIVSRQCKQAPKNKSNTGKKAYSLSLLLIGNIGDGLNATRYFASCRGLVMEVRQGSMGFSNLGTLLPTNGLSSGRKSGVREGWLL